MVAGFAKAAEISEREHEARARRCAQIKRKFLEAISCFRYETNGDQRYCLPSSINVSIDGLDAEAAFLCLRNEYAFSNGSACNASSHQLSYVLDAMLASSTIFPTARIEVRREEFEQELFGHVGGAQD